MLPLTFSQCIDHLNYQTKQLGEIIIINGNLEGRNETESMKIGVERAKGDILFFTNLDCYVPQNWVEKHLEWHSRGFDLVSGIRIQRDRIGASWNPSIYQPRNFQTFGAGFTGSNASVKRSIIEKIGWPKELPTAWDVELAFRAKSYNMIIDPSIVVEHDHSILTRKDSFLKARKYAFNSIYLMKAYNGKVGIFPNDVMPSQLLKMWKQNAWRQSFFGFCLNKFILCLGRFFGTIEVIMN